MATLRDASTHAHAVEPVDECLVSPVIDMVFRQWTTPILWELQQHERLRFMELREKLGAITAKTLTQRLRQLERDGLVVRTQYLEVPPRVEYEITDLGMTLCPLFRQLAGWAREHMPQVQTAHQRYDDSGRPRPS